MQFRQFVTFAPVLLCAAMMHQYIEYCSTCIRCYAAGHQKVDQPMDSTVCSNNITVILLQAAMTLILGRLHLWCQLYSLALQLLLLLHVCRSLMRALVDQLSEQKKQRYKARVEAIRCYYQNNEVIKQAIKAFKLRWNATAEEPISDVRSFIQGAVDKLENLFTLWNITPSGPCEKISKEEILVAADILASGYMLLRVVIQGSTVIEYYEHRYFTSVKQAIMSSDYLASLLDRYDVSSSYLLKKFKRYRSDLQYHVLYMRQPLAVRIIKQRIKYCETMLMKIDPVVGRSDYLEDIHWMDECTIHVGKDLIQNKLHVWSYRYDTEGDAQSPILCSPSPRASKSTYCWWSTAAPGALMQKF